MAHAGAAGRRGAVKIAFDLTERTDPMSRRPGFVLEVDKSTPPTLFWHGEGFTLETLPEGSRVIYAPEPIEPLEDPYRAIRDALLHPVGDRDPLPALLRPGMKLTICFDDISLPLPPMEAPDVRQMVIETVLDMAAEAGVDDVVLIGGARPAPPHDRGRSCATPSATASTTPSPRTACSPSTTPRTPTNLVYLGRDRPGRGRRDQQAGGHLDLLVYVNINLVAMDGGHKSVATGPGQLPQPAPPPQPPDDAAQPKSFMDQHRSELHSSNWRMGRLIADSRASRSSRSRRRSTTTPSRPNFAFLQKREWEWSLRDRATYAGDVEGARPDARRGSPARSSTPSAPRTG